jgi:hypothetical protein
MYYNGAPNDGAQPPGQPPLNSATPNPLPLRPTMKLVTARRPAFGRRSNLRRPPGWRLRRCAYSSRTALTRNDDDGGFLPFRVVRLRTMDLLGSTGGVRSAAASVALFAI